MAQSTKTGRSSGFTLMELMIVLTIMSILIGIAIPVYHSYIRSTNEVVLKNNLHELRKAIDMYTADKKKAPQTLTDLVEAGYFRELPLDPMTRSRDTWEPVTGTTVASPDQTETGITDVRSGSAAMSSENTAYNTW